MGMVFRHSGEYNLYYNMSAAQKAQWQKWSGNNPKGTFDNWLSKYGPPLGLPARAPAAAAGDLPGAAAGTPGAAAPAFDPQQQQDYNDKFWSILYGGQDNENDYLDAVLNDQMATDALALNYKKARIADADDESARGLTATGYAYHHFADLDAENTRNVGIQAAAFARVTARYDANIARFNQALSQLGEEGNIKKFLNVGQIAAGTAPRSIAPAAPAAAPAAPAPAPAPAAPVAAVPTPAQREGLGNPQFDPKAQPPASGVQHQPAQNYQTAPASPTRTKLNAVEYSRRLKAIRDRHGAGSAEVNNFRSRNYY